jgi:IclR family KDG regulon transcriptional repressor
MPQIEQNRALDQQAYKAYTPSTLTNRAALLTELAQIKADGVAYDREEHEQGIISIACPILTGQGRVVGAVSIASSTNRYTIDDLEKQRPNLLKSANLIGSEAELWQVPTWS